MRRPSLLITLLGLAATAATAGSLQAQAPPTLVPFQDFVASLTTAAPAGWVGQPGNQVATATDFNDMRQHLIDLYQGITVAHSFLLDSLIVDCVPIGQQPGLQPYGVQALVPAPPSPDDDGVEPPAGSQQVTSTLDLGLVDALGNAVSCDDGTIPMRRVTLDELSRFASLAQYLQKSPDGVGAPDPTLDPTTDPAVAKGHRYAYAYQFVDNLGGNAWLDLWSPPVATSVGEHFSLSQEWYVGGSGSHTQTAEAGVQNFPQHYDVNKSVLFIFWTPDNYKHGCYNLECKAFVQTNRHWTLGATFAEYSTAGGLQVELRIKWKWYLGNWWLYVGGDSVGYYPETLYGTGAMAANAALVEFGGEVWGEYNWPPMGSGDWPSRGFSYAAYQHSLYYIGLGGHRNWGDLTIFKHDPQCYGIDYTASGAISGWVNDIYFGGPGGGEC